MEVRQYLEQFGLGPKEMKLHILQCSATGAPQIDKDGLNIVSIQADKLNKLPFPDQSFDLAVCSNILFAEEVSSKNFELEALLELARVAGEVRVFPLVDKQGKPSPTLGPILQALQQQGLGVELRQVGDKRGEAAAMLRLWNERCLLT